MMSQQAPAALPKRVSRSLEMKKGAGRSTRTHSASMERRNRGPGSAGSASVLARFITTPRLQEDTVYMTPSETQLATMLAYSYSFTLFVDLQPVQHWCAPPEMFTNLSEQQWKNAAIPRDSNGDFKQCERYEPIDTPASPLVTPTFQAASDVAGNMGASTQQPVLLRRTNASEVPCESFVYVPGTPGRSAVARWDLVCSRSWYQDLLKAAYTGGEDDLHIAP
ncbi:hypothetical protein HPB50_017097 [Hyalomma asiaticum]|uniref:Uncharacterized protein n=1 Tax=Hyalomma asiaticum TaxID=266040 RepID=A0ACB7RV63_HYAAI|nr:hypothetical protein HPB50_017097 [Hyalomma asiaticum]